MKRRCGLVSALLVFGVIVLAESHEAVAQPAYLANGFAEYHDNSRVKVRRFPDLIAIQPIPSTVDPFAIETWPLSCITFVRLDDETGGFSGVKGAKVTHEATLYTLNSQEGTFQAFDLGSKKIKSDAGGRVHSFFEIPAALFADGFESGDTIAWVVATARFKGGRKANGASLGCNTDHLQ